MDYTFDYTDYTLENVGVIIRDYTWSVFSSDYTDYTCFDYTDYTFGHGLF